MLVCLDAGPGRPQHGPVAAVPPWPDEAFACAACGLRYPDLSVPAAVALVAGVPAAARAAVADVPDAVLRRRPPAGGWSAAEYLCHLRDVAVSYTIRLHRARTEDRPVLEPMRGDLRARRFRYADADLPAVLGELTAAGPVSPTRSAGYRPTAGTGSWSGCPARSAPPAG